MVEGEDPEQDQEMDYGDEGEEGEMDEDEPMEEMQAVMIEGEGDFESEEEEDELDEEQDGELFEMDEEEPEDGGLRMPRNRAGIDQMFRQILERGHAGDLGEEMDIERLMNIRMGHVRPNEPRRRRQNRGLGELYPVAPVS
jgi:hypothetical protein